MRNEKFEEWFDVAFERAVSSTSITSEDSKKASWNQLQSRIQEVQRVRKRRRHMQMASVVAASFIAGAIFFSPPTVTNAISPFYQKIVSWGDGVVNIFFGTRDLDIDINKAKTSPPPLGFLDNNNETMSDIGFESLINEENIVGSLDNINNKISFTLPTLSGIPLEYQFKDLYLSEPDSDRISNRISLVYTNSYKQFLTITIIKLTTTTNFSSMGTDQTETILLKNGNEAYYTAGATNEIIFLNNNLSIRILGIISKEEMLKLVESFLN
ncbi:DUF4367 domain-containing protein [Paenibacillus pini]|uniref:DUF4367 domain-containing protein n=2 Tax=Paenibacillus TaxID=44249 RepID=W7YIJ6_9BACL|nr:hypothetical protein JCM16418_1459 [Paenibacillus pini JCM 16418]